MSFQNIPNEQIDYFKLKSPEELQLQKWSLAHIFLHIVGHTHSFEGSVFPIPLGKDPVPQVIWPATKINKYFFKVTFPSFTSFYTPSHPCLVHLINTLELSSLKFIGFCLKGTDTAYSGNFFALYSPSKIPK